MRRGKSAFREGTFSTQDRSLSLPLFLSLCGASGLTPCLRCPAEPRQETVPHLGGPALPGGPGQSSVSWPSLQPLYLGLLRSGHHGAHFRTVQDLETGAEHVQREALAGYVGSFLLALQSLKGMEWGGSPCPLLKRANVQVHQPSLF